MPRRLTAAPSFQIDSIDPAFAPATGTPETGGWSTRELRTILRGLDGLHIVSADIVEVAPDYDTQGTCFWLLSSCMIGRLTRPTPDEITSIAAANIGWEILGLMAKTPLVE